MRNGLVRGRVSWLLPENKKCIELANFGFSTICIAEETQLTVNQVRYRLSLKGLYLSNYRNGYGTAASVVLRRFRVVSKTG